MKGILLLATLFVCNAIAQQAIGICHVQGTAANPGMTGVITFSSLDGGDVTISVKVSGITTNPGIAHGIHIHEFGDISMENGTSVGGHYNPLNRDHSCPETQDVLRHMGDTGNWNVGADGSIDQTKTINLIALTGAQSLIGRAVIIHSSTDDCATVPSSGARLGQCVIGIAKPEGNATNAAVSSADVSRASCYLQPIGNSSVSGYVLFTQPSAVNPTTIQAAVYGINNEMRAIHIHTYGDLSDDVSGLSTGGHFNPFGSSHSLPGYNSFHVGDLGNIYTFENDVGYYKYISNVVNLTGINNILGRAVVIHSMKDDCSTSYGTRVAYCVIGINGGVTSLAVPPTVPTTQPIDPCLPPQPTSGSVSSNGGSTAGSTGSDNDSAASANVAFGLVSIVALLFHLL